MVFLVTGSSIERSQVPALHYHLNNIHYNVTCIDLVFPQICEHPPHQFPQYLASCIQSEARKGTCGCVWKCAKKHGPHCRWIFRLKCFEELGSKTRFSVASSAYETCQLVRSFRARSPRAHEWTDKWTPTLRLGIHHFPHVTGLALTLCTGIAHPPIFNGVILASGRAACTTFLFIGRIFLFVVMRWSIQTVLHVRLEHRRDTTLAPWNRMWPVIRTVESECDVDSTI